MTILERHFSLVYGVSIFFWTCVEKCKKTALLRGEFFFLEIDHMGYPKIENFMLISKMQTFNSDKMPPKKLKLKN